MRIRTRLSSLPFALSALLATAAAAQVDLRLKVSEGVTHVKTTITTKQVLSLAGMEIPTEARVVSQGLQTTSKPASDGTSRVEEKTTGFTIHLTTPAGNLDYDIEKPDPQAGAGTPLQPLVAGFDALKGLAYTVVLKDGKVTAVEGISEALSRVPPAALDTLKHDLNAEQITRDWQQQLDSVPAQPVKKGDTWTRTEVMNIGSGQSLTFGLQYEYVGQVEKEGRSLDKVSIVLTNVKYAVKDGALGGLKVVNSDLKVDQSFGHYLLNREKGMVVERSTNVRVTGPMTFEINGQQLPGKVDLSLDVNTVSR